MTGVWFFVVIPLFRATYYETQSPVDACYDLHARDKGRKVYSIIRMDFRTDIPNKVQCDFDDNGKLIRIWESGERR